MSIPSRRITLHPTIPLPVIHISVFSFHTMPCTKYDLYFCFGKWQCRQRFFKEKVFHDSRLGRGLKCQWLHKCAGMCIRRTLATVDLSPIPYYFMNESDPMSWHRLLKSKTIKNLCVQIQKPLNESEKWVCLSLPLSKYNPWGSLV